MHGKLDALVRDCFILDLLTARHIWFASSSRYRYEEISIEYHDIIIGHFAGHTHKDEKRIVFDAQGRPTSIM
jgi:hypothetical protein